MSLPALVLVHGNARKGDRRRADPHREIDTCHDLMVSEPERLAEILVDRCRRHSR